MDIKNQNLYNNKNSYAPIIELTTHLLKRFVFFFLQLNKNPIPLMGCTTQSRERENKISHQTNKIQYIII